MSRKNQEAERELRRKKVAANLLAGLTYRAMAEALGVSIGTISEDVKIILGRWRREQVGQMAEVIGLETTRLDRALNAIWDKVLAGDQRAIQTMLKIMERRAKLLGLDSAQIQSNLNLDLWQLSDQQLQRIANGENPLHVLATSSSGDS